MTPRAVRGGFTLQELSQMDRHLDERVPLHIRQIHQLLATLCTISYNLWTAEKTQKLDVKDFAPWLFPPELPKTEKDLEREADLALATAMGFDTHGIGLKPGQRIKNPSDVDWDAEEI